ncbi:type I-G CRISPR-associated protein, Cas3-extension family [Candidatus Poriferisodalis sp.]|uniref:type I-G CRISPR-associated protein, Cas3-extension family n=1 Tax=Candidatus Poriferisodalis sp. TaxID=3101277 RepID=UPI003B52AFC1
MPEMHLPGLPGNSPLGFLAALGTQVALADAGRDFRLSWTDSLIPVAAIDPACEVDEIATHVVSLARRWAIGPALDPLPKRDDAKFPVAAIRDYLSSARETPDGVLAMSFVAENSVDVMTGSKAKPTDFDFTSGNQKLFHIARRILSETRMEDIEQTLEDAWQYDERLPSLGWDVNDDRQYALSAFNPTNTTSNPKLACPGVQCLAILGLCQYPVFRGLRKTATTACYGTWNRGAFSWPLWERPASRRVVRTLIAHTSIPETAKANTRTLSFSSRVENFPGWGIIKIMSSDIDRSAKYGRFSPPRVIWQRA